MIRNPVGPTLASVLVVLAGMSAGCASSYNASYPEPRPLISAHPVESIDDPVTLEGPLTLAEAVALAIQHNPTLRSASFELQAREHDAYQAGRPPNPELEAGVHEFGGSGSRSGVQSLEVGGGFSQTLELGGDRRARADVAARSSDRAAWDVESTRLNVVTEVRQAFTSVLAAEARLALAEEQGEIARRLADAVERRAAEGAVSPLEARRARVAAVTAVTVLERARRAVLSARARLASTFGGEAAAIDVEGDLSTLAPVPELERLTPLLQLNPELAQYAAILDEARAHARLERASRIPDPTFRFGAAYFNEVGEAAVTSGISIPIPFLDTNRGAIRAAEARISAVEADAESALLRAEWELTTLYGTLAVSVDAARMLRDDALPNARAASEGILTGYHEGEFDLLNVLDAQSALIETQNAYIDALADYHQARAAVERLIATPIHAVEDALRSILPNQN
jgi:cobalt-zinc-cadmium efflux system outer membrane protein